MPETTLKDADLKRERGYFFEGQRKIPTNSWENRKRTAEKGTALADSLKSPGNGFSLMENIFPKGAGGGNKHA